MAASNYTNATTGVILVLFGTNTDESILIQRAPDITGSAGTYTTIGTIYPVDLGGSPFVDQLPLDNQYRWYQAYGTDSGLADSNFTNPIRIKPVAIPAVDLGVKPWLAATHLQLVMNASGGLQTVSISGSNYSGYIITASVNKDPLNAAVPVISVLTYAGLPMAPMFFSGSWFAQAPTTGSGVVAFENIMQNRYAAYSSVAIIAAASTGSSQPAMSVTVGNCTATNNGVTGPPYNRLDVTFSYSGVPTGDTFTVTYNNAGGGNGSTSGVAQTSSPQTVTFNSVTFGGSPGTGTITVTIMASDLTIATATKTKTYLT